MNKDEKLQKIVSLCKRRGFIYPSSEIYGGLANTYDFGPYGTELKENLRQIWWKKFILSREDLYGIDSSMIISPKVWEASGHLASFADVMVEDSKTHRRYRADHIIEEYFEKKGEEVKVDGKSAEELQEIIQKEGIKSPVGNKFTEAKKFNLLFETEIGIVEDSKNKAYLRGEIAQGLFINFKNILDSIHPKLPFGIGQTGKVFRNEITKGQFTFRTLEFDLMEFEYFFDPEEKEWNEIFDFWKKEIYDYAMKVGLNKKNLKWRPHEKFELSHYSKHTEDLEYKFPWGYKEMFACAYRTDFDLKNHEKHSGQEMKFTTPEGKKIAPHVMEPTFGLSRLVTILLMDAYQEDEAKTADGKMEKRVYLKFNKEVAPVKIAILPLSKKEKLQKVSREVYRSLKDQYHCEYDETQSIGKRYRRQDEIGTPYCVTVDFDSLDDKAVTIRDRDTMKQERIKIEALPKYFADHFRN